MNKRISRGDEKALADRLNREAAASRVAFSEDLHARICGALRQSETPAAQLPAAATWRRWVPAAVAATVVVGASLLAWQLVGNPQPEPVHTDVTASLPEPPDLLPALDEVIRGMTERPAERVGMMVDSTLGSGQWAYLDHDARLAVVLLTDPLPFEIASIGEP